MANLENDPLFRRIRQHASRRIKFEDATPMEERVPHYKKFLHLEDEMLRRYHKKGDSGFRVARARAIIIDVLIEHLFETALVVFHNKEQIAPYEVSVTATGGYGRAELCPHSDIDIMFLYPNKMIAGKIESFKETLVAEILYPLWDLNLKVGHASRTIEEVIPEAKRDFIILNSLLDIRCICGSSTLYDKLTTKYNAYCKKIDINDALREQVEERRSRRNKYFNTVFLQAPEIKNGVGGLRDVQSVQWMARLKYGINSLVELQENGFLSKRELYNLQYAYSFLLRVRNSLHFASKRPVDSLPLEKQAEVAEDLGYDDEDIMRRIEKFMRDYYRHAKCVNRITQILVRKITAVKKTLTFKDVISAYRNRGVDSEKMIDGFIIDEDNKLLIPDTSILTEDPNRMIRIFRHCQQHDYGIHYETSSILYDHLHLITPRVRNDEGANATFRAILQTAGKVHKTLQVMNNVGVLGQFIPEFGKLNCLVQHEFYHRYTADTHVLNCIKNLDLIYQGTFPESEKYINALRRTHTPNLLYLILFLHDIGKSEGIKGHAFAGVAISKPLLKRFGIPERFNKVILFIVEHHLEMSRFWQKFDMDDPETYKSFAKFIQDEDTLRYLYVHTFCDAKATSESLWNDYKQLQHSQLFHRTLQELNRSDSMQGMINERKINLREKIKESQQLEHISKEEQDAHFELLPDRYFLNTKADDIERHLQMINELFTSITQADSKETLTPIIKWSDNEDQGFSVVEIITWDRAGLFFKLAGAFSLSGFNILSSKVVSRKDNIVIDSFCIVDEQGGAAKDKKKKEIFESIIHEVLVNNKDLWADLVEKSETPVWGTTKPDSEKIGVKTISTVDVHEDLSLKQTLVEVTTSDHIGILYNVTKTISNHAFDITYAKISTENSVAIDTFYIKPTKLDKRNSDLSNRHKKLKASIKEVLEDASYRTT